MSFHMCLFLHVCMCRPEVNLRFYYMVPSTLYFEVGFLLGTWNSLTWLDWLASKSKGSTCVSCPGIEIISIYGHTQLFFLMWVLPTKVRYLCWYSKRFTSPKRILFGGKVILEVLPYMKLKTVTASYNTSACSVGWISRCYV